VTVLLTTTAHPTLSQHPDPDGRPIHRALGRLIQPRHTSSIEATAEAGIEWAADNDCFQGLDRVAYIRMLKRIAGLPGCRFVTVPDVVGDAAATAELFEEWAPVLEDLELPLALVAQDGFNADAVEWDRLDALFIGGTDDFKLGPDGASAAREAKRRGLWVHWGRVNSRKRFDLIRATGTADSFDGSKWSRFRKTYLDQGLSWCLERDVAAEELSGAITSAVDRVRFIPSASPRPMVGSIELADGSPARWVVGDAPTIATGIR
jgi:hypothetical protein